MKSKIQNITPTYTKFENILPDELSHTQITEELEEAKNEINNIIEEDLRKVKTFYADYINASARHEKGIEFNHFVRAYQDFNRYLISIYNTINQYYDLFVQVCNEIDPNNKEQTLTQFQSDIDYRELL